MDRQPEVVEKLTALLGYVDELEECTQVSLDEYRANRILRRAVERLCQVIVECAVDVNSILVDDAGRPPPRSARESFEEAHTLGVLDEDVRRRFCQTYVGLRNRIVHDYDTLDDRILLASAQRLVGDARRFVANVDRHQGEPQ